MVRGVNWLLAAGAAVGLVALQAGCRGRSSGREAPGQSRATSVSCVLPVDGRAADAYQAAITAFLGASCYASWQHDPKPRLTGQSVNGTTYSVHDYIKVFYSPSLVTWMQVNRPVTGVSPNTVAPMPQDAAIVAEIYPSATATNPSGRFVMARQTAAPAAARPASGWFFSQIVADAGSWHATSLTTSVGDYSLGQCIGCHASAVNNLTYVSTSNLLGKALPLADWQPSFSYPSTNDLPAAVTPPASRQLRQPVDDATAQQFIDFYNSAVTEFQQTKLPAVSQLPSSLVLAIPGQDTDNYYVRDGQPSFVTSSQCKGCHDANALLSVQSGGTYTWAAPQMSFKHPSGWGGTPPPADKFNLSPYGEWSVSIMALAARDPVFLAQAETERVLRPDHVTPTVIDNFCFRCHGSMGQRQFHRDNGGDPTQFPPDKQPKPQGNFSHYMLYLPPGGCTDLTKFPCNQPGMTPANAKYGALARDGVSCAMCHHTDTPDSRTDPWSVLYGFPNPAVGAVEAPLGINYPFSGSVGYDLTQLVAPPQDKLTIGYLGNNNAEIWGHQQSFKVSTAKDNSLPQGEFCGGCHVVIAPAIPIMYPQARNMGQIDPVTGQITKPATYPGTNTPCPDVTPGIDGKYDPTTDPCVQQAYEQTTYLEWAASASFGGSTGRQASCTYCHMPLASSTGPGMSIANTESPGNTDGVGGLPPVAFRADQQLKLSANAGYPRHRLMAINLFVHEMFQQFPNILGLITNDGAVPPDTVLNLQNAEETILSHAPTTVAISVCTPGSSDQSCKNVQGDAQSLTYQVTVANLSGHRFPTGAGFRRGFLEFRLLDASDKTLWVSGAVNAQGAILDGGTGNLLATEFPPTDQKYQPSFLQPHFGTPVNPAITQQGQVQIYEVRATDEYGKLTTSTTRLFGGAKDNRIPPTGWIPPYDCTGAQTAATAQRGKMVKGLDQFVLSRVTAPDKIIGTGSKATIEAGSAFSDPDFCTPGRDQALGIAGVDHVLYKIPKAALKGQQVAKVKVVMHYQTIPPYFLRDRFLDGRQAKVPGEGGVVGLGAATERLLYVSSHLNMNIDNTIPDQGNLPKQVAQNWTMDIGTVCFPADAGCPSQQQLSGERKLLQGVYDRQGVLKTGGGKRK
jgi:hypothetical protein